jgi:hypothetical protein
MATLENLDAKIQRLTDIKEVYSVKIPNPYRSLIMASFMGKRG